MAQIKFKKGGKVVDPKAPSTTAKAAAKTKPKKTAGQSLQDKLAEDIERAKELADIIIETNAEIVAAKDPGKKQAAAKKELIELVNDEYAPTEEIIVEGTKGSVSFGVKAEVRTVTDMKALHEKLGDEVFYKICSVGLGKIDDYLTKSEQKDLIDYAYGSRGMKIIPKTSK